MTTDTDMAVVSGISQETKPRFVAEELASPSAVANWLNKMAAQDYHLVQIISMMQTNHFNKEVGSVVWVVAELDEQANLPRR